VFAGEDRRQAVSFRDWHNPSVSALELSDDTFYSGMWQGSDFECLGECLDGFAIWSMLFESFHVATLWLPLKRFAFKNIIVTRKQRKFINEKISPYLRFKR
jgi:hypothetical protein